MLERFVEKEKTQLWYPALASFSFSTNTTLEKIASAFGIEIEDLIKKDEPITVDSFENCL